MKTNKIISTIEKEISNQLLTKDFSMIQDAQSAIHKIATILANKLPQPKNFQLYPPHYWVIDSAHGVETISLLLDNSYQEADWDFETPIIQELNFNLESNYSNIRVTSSNIADGLILLNISHME